jgi:sphingolipid delta-4 desaturase
LKDSNLWLVLTAAWVFGAWFNHALYVFIHDSTHNLVFKSEAANRLIGMVCDFALVTPSAMAFRKYHLLHHARMGQFDYDADLVTPREAKLIGNNPLKKTLWVLFLGISQAMRPMRMASRGFWDRWLVTNTLIQIGVIALSFYFLGPVGVAYLFASSIFGLGLHPLGARWIAEHFLTDPKQETYSYYGPMNAFMFNVGYHTEHHDLMTVSWNRLPRIREVAPEFYRDLKSYSSYPKLLIRFIVDPKLSLYSRMIRKTAKVEVSDDAILHEEIPPIAAAFIKAQA